MSTSPPPPPKAPRIDPPTIPRAEDHMPNTMEHIVPARNIPALVSWYLGVFGLIPILGIPLSLGAILSGIYGLIIAKRPKVQVGRGHAIAGIILGTVMGVFLPLIILIVANFNPGFVNILR